MSGDTDKIILEQLHIVGYKMFNVICYDTCNTKTFGMQLSIM